MSDETLHIQHDRNAAGGVFFLEEQGARLAELTYQRATPDLVVVDHTFVDEELRGRGVARKLLDALVDWARATQTRVKATCSYARAQFKHDASIRDVYAG